MAPHPPRPSGNAAPSLHLAPPPPADQPDNRVPVAVALLGPINPWLDDFTTRAVTSSQADNLLSDPRYVIGRLHQALTAMLADDLPPMDATQRCLYQAIEDAVAYRHRTCPECDTEGNCATCSPHWRKAD